MAFPILLAAFIIVPILEITVLVKVGGAIGLGSTILFVIFTAILGAHLVRQQGFATLHAVQSELNAGRVPAMQMAEGIGLLFAGALLLTPGFITDAVGFALLTPPIRQAIIKLVSQQGMFQMKTAYTDAGSFRTTSDTQSPKSSAEVIEGEYSERE